MTSTPPNDQETVETVCRLLRLTRRTEEEIARLYRDRAEMEPWLANDQMNVVGDMIEPERRRFIDAAVERQIGAAVEFAENSPWPDPQELYSHVFTD